MGVTTRLGVSREKLEINILKSLPLQNFARTVQSYTFSPCDCLFKKKIKNY